MFVGPDHPIFSDRFTPSRSGIGGGHREGPWGGDGFLPPMGAPPGARFDPVGPFGAPSGRGPGGGSPFGGSGGRNGLPRSSEPDNDEFMPPGMVGFPRLLRFVYSILSFTGGHVFMNV